MRSQVDLRELPFYRGRLGASPVPEAWSLDELEDFAAASSDPFGGRLRPGDRVEVALQLEATSEPPVWTALEPRELDVWAAGVSRMWRRLGLARDDVIAFFDYGSNPCVLLSTSIYVARLKRGAVERLGATSICNDGVASMTGRMLTILGAVRPAALVVRRDLIAPLTDMLATRGVPPNSRLRWAAVVEVEGAARPADAESLRQALGVPVRRLLRADAAFLAAADCAECGLFHLDRRLYEVEQLAEGELAVTAR
ncbi:MAG: hypothetical protein ACREQQ_13100, partial [Candidatus Binatia bacterium]